MHTGPAAKQKQDTTEKSEASKKNRVDGKEATNNLGINRPQDKAS